MFRKATSKDLKEIARVHSEAWHAAYGQLINPEILSGVTPESRLRFWEQWFESEDQNVTLLIENRSVLGFTRICSAQPLANPPKNYGELTHLYLDPVYVSRGYGHQLFTMAYKDLEAQGFEGMVLWTLEGNYRARRFYEAHRMHHDGMRVSDPKWLGEGVFEIRYVLPFPGES